MNFSRVELEKEIDLLPDKIYGNVLKSLAKSVDFPDVKKLGALSTKRLVKRFDGAEIDLDESCYFGKTDYEIEIEFTDENKARELLENVRNLIGESASESEVCTGKIHRFLEEFQKQE